MPHKKLLNILDYVSSFVILALVVSFIVWCSQVAAIVGIQADSISVDTRCANGRMGRGKCPQGHEYVPPAQASFFGTQSSTFAADHDFDFAETFDGLQVWTPKPSDGGVGENPADTALMPKLLDGSDSPWTFYTKYGTDAETTNDNWIDAYGDNRVWRGTKSAAIDIQNKSGPSRLGMFLPTGYHEKVHYFFMVNIPSNEWPTSCPYEEDGVTPTGDGTCNSAAQGLYEEGQPYRGHASWKFMTFNYGCEFEECWDEPGAGGYSPVWHQISHIKRWNYTTESSRGLTGLSTGLKVNMETPESDGGTAWGHTEEFKGNINGYIGDWFGIEYALTQTDDCKTVYEVWIYDQSGVAVKPIDGYTFDTVGCTVGNTLDWDYFFHGGNNSNTYSWGPTMQSVYFIDDVIIDDQRIGPKYFSAIGVTP